MRTVAALEVKLASEPTKSPMYSLMVSTEKSSVSPLMSKLYPITEIPSNHTTFSFSFSVSIGTSSVKAVTLAYRT